MQRNSFFTHGGSMAVAPVGIENQQEPRARDLAPAVLAPRQAHLPVGGHRCGTERTHVLIDAERWDELSAYRWYRLGRHVARSEGPRGARQRIYLQRQVVGLGATDERVVLFLHGVGDYREASLRIVTPAERNQRTSSRQQSTSRHRGVSWRRDRARWQAQACVGERRVHLGYFDSEYEAADAVAEWRHHHMPLSPEATA